MVHKAYRFVSAYYQTVPSKVQNLHYASNPLLSGFLSSKNERLLKDAPALFAKRYKKGIVILFVDDMNFRSYWFGTSKIFMNAVFFNKCIN